MAKYKWDEKKQDYVLDSGSDNNSGKTYDKYTWDEKKQDYIKSGTFGGSFGEMQPDPEYDRGAYASAGAQDLYGASKFLSSFSKIFEDNIYKLGGSEKIAQNGQVQDVRKIAGSSNIWQNNLAAGKDLLGLTDDEYQMLLDAAEDDEAYAKAVANIAIARTGGLDTIDTTGMKKSEVKELERDDKLSQRDDTYAALSMESEKQHKTDISSLFDSPEAYATWLASGEADEMLSALLPERKTYDDWLNVHNAYPLEAMRKDIQAIWSYNTERNVNGTTPEEYEAARRRVYAMTGKDYGPIAQQSGGADNMWTIEALDTYRGTQDALRAHMSEQGVFGGDISPEEWYAHNEAYNDYLTYSSQQGKMLDEWENKADTATSRQLNSAGSSIDYYRPAPMYLNIDPTYLEGHREYQYEDGTFMPHEEYRQNAIDEWLMAYVDAGNDEAKIAALDVARGEYLPELEQYNLDKLRYLDDDQKKAIFSAFNNGNVETAKNLIDTYDPILNYERVKGEGGLEDQIAAEYQNANVLGKIGQNLGAIAQAPARAFEGIKQAIWSVLAPEELEKITAFSPEYDKIRTDQIITQMTGDEIAALAPDANIPFTDKNALRATYSGIKSGAESALIAKLLAPLGGLAKVGKIGKHAAPIISSMMVGGQGFGSERMGKLESGHDEDDATQDAWVKWLTETATELPFFENLFGSSPGFWKKLKSGLTSESMGEAISQFGGDLYDELKYGTVKDRLMTEGYGFDGENMWWEWVKEVFPDTAEAWFSGLIAAGVPTTVSAASDTMQNANYGNNLRNNDGADLAADLVESLPVDDVSKDIAKRWKAERAESKKGEQTETAVEDKASITKEDAAAEARETEQAARDRGERADDAKDSIEEDAASVTKEDAEAAVREAEQAERDRGERSDDTKGAVEEDAAAVTKEDADAMVKKADQIARDLNESADKGKGGKTGEAIAEGGVTKADAEAAVKKMKQTARDKGGRSDKGKRSSSKPVSNAELGYMYRQAMEHLDEGAKKVFSDSFSRDVLETELAKAGFRGDMRWAADVVTKFINGNTGKNIIKALESNEVVRQVALDLMGDVQAIRAEYRSKAENIAQRASKDFVKPETTKAEKGAQEATQGIDDRAAVTEDDVFAMTDEDIDVEIAEAEESTVDGKAVTIEGVAKVAEDGSVTYNVKDADGNVTEVAEGDVAYGQNDGNVARLVAMAKDLGRNAETMIKSYAEGQSVAQYAKAFKQAMQYGEDGQNLEVVKGRKELSVLNEAQAKVAYEMGRGIRTQRNNEMVRKNVSGIKVGQVDTSGINGVKLTDHQRKSVHTMSRLAKAVGFNIRFVESKANAKGKYTTENGSWDPRTLTLTLDVHAGSNSTTDTKYAMMHTAGHELTHYIRQFADADLWNGYQEFVIGHLSKKTGEDFDLETEIANGMRRGLSRDAAIEEVIADASGEALNSITEADIQAMAETNPGLLEKVKQFFERWIKSVKAAIKAAYKDTEAKTGAAKQMMDAVDEMGKRWNEMLVNATRNRAADAQTAMAEDVASETTEKFSARRPVEYTKNLVAVHNLTESKLQKALKLGGFPMPSIAITKADIGHSNFGNISLVFGSETVDPEFMRRNTVYSADAWTPTFPQIEYEVNEKAEKRITDKYYALAKVHGYDFVRPMYTIANNLEEQLDRYGGEEGLIDHLRDDTNMMQMYIAETKGEPVANVTHEKVTRIAPELVKKYEYFIGKLGRDVVLETEVKDGESPIMRRKAWLEKHGEKLNEAYLSYLAEAGIDEETAKIVLQETKPMKLVMEVVNARKYIKNGAETVTVETDTNATDAAIRKAATGYEEWLNDLIRGTVKDSGVYNNKELYTASGNRRSFKQTHYSVTLENIAKSMAGQNEGNSRNVSGFYGVKSLRAGTAKRFKSIAEMHELAGRLKKLTESEAQSINDALAERLDVLMNKIYNTKSHNQHGDMFLAMDAIGNMLMEAAELSNKSVENIKKVCADYHYKLNDSVVNEIRELLFDVEQMPVNIFEAKPERAVGFDEVRYAIVPDSLSNDTLNALRNEVHDVRVYPDGDEAARIELLNAREDLKFQVRDLSHLSDRELLVGALDTELTEAERDHLERYKIKLDGLAKDQKQLEDLNEKIVQLRNQGFTPKTSEELRAAETNATTLRGRIDRKDAELNKIESAAMIKELIRRNRREASKKRTVDLREWQEKEKYRDMLEKDAKKLHKWLVSPTSKGYAPEFLRKPLGDFLEQIDFTSKRALRGGEETWSDEKFKDSLEELRRAIAQLGGQQQNIEDGAEDFMGYIDLPVNFVQDFDENVRAIKKALDMGSRKHDTPVNRMTAQQMREMSQMFRVLNSSIVKVNTLVSNGRYTSAKLAADDTINDLNEMKARAKTNKALEQLNSTFNWKNTTPYYVFQRLGRGGKDMFERLMNGWDKMAYNSAKVIEYSENTFTGKEAREWSREITEVKLDSEDVIQMTTAQKMSLYCLQKRPQAQGHLLGGGIRISDIDGKRGSKITQADNYVLTADDIYRITTSLTERQREVADKLQEFMNTVCAEWGNEISMKRFGFRQMTELMYFPIETDSNNRKKIDESKDGSTSMFRLLNMSSLKPLVPKANNAIVIKDIFNVFSDHASDMAKYNALALPILDFIKWYNHVEVSEVRDDSGRVTGQITTRSTQKALERAFGTDAKSYLTAFVKDLNAEHDGGRNDGLINSIVGRAKSAAVGANLRVYGLQITSLPRAAFAINPAYLIKGMAKVKSLNPASAIKGTEAQENVGILKWKNLGFYSTDVARSTRGMVKRSDGFMTKVRDIAMMPAGWGDNWVSNIIYEAAKAELADKRKDLKPGTKAYEKALNDRVREIVYKTQVVDSTMTRSDFMRSKGLMSTLTAFMSEPTLTVNMLNEGIQKAVEVGRKGGNWRKELLDPKGLTVRAATTFAFTAVVTSLVESAFDGLRDDDEYERFMEKFSSAFKGNIIDNVNVFAMLPFLKDAISIFQGYENSSLITQGVQQWKDFKTSIESWQNGKAPIYRVIYNGMKAAGSMAGVGLGNATRDAASLYNTFFAPVWGTPKLQTYEDTESTAATAYYNAMAEGRTEDAAYYMERMQANELDMEKVNKKLVSLAGDGFVAGNVSEADARKWLNDAGYTKDKTEDKIRDMQFKKETGVAYSDFKSAYVDGTFSKTEATRLLKKYRGYDDNKIYFTLQEWEGGEDWTKYGAFLDAVDNRSGYAAEAKKLLDHGVEKGDIASAIAKAYKEAYREIHGTQAGNLMLEYLLDVYEAIGYDRDYERKYITKNWIKD